MLDAVRLRFVYLNLVFIWNCCGISASYQRYTFSDTAVHVAHILQVEPAEVDIVLAHALEQREPVSMMVERAHALAGINAGFFRRGGMFNGNSLNLLKIESHIYADPGLCRGTLVWNSPLDMRINTLQLQWQVIVGDQCLSVFQINQPYVARKLMLYLPTFGTYTHAPCGCAQVVISKEKVAAVVDEGDCEIPADGCVVVFDEQYIEKHPKVKELAVGQVARVMVSVGDGNVASPLSLATYMVNGAGTLVKDGIVQTAEQINGELQEGNALAQLADEASINYHDAQQTQWLIHGRHPRTAVGVTKSGSWLFVVVEGRKKNVEGLTLPELATYMRSLGCEQALNLGGGGDSTFVFEGKLVNVPSGGSQGATFTAGERPVSDAILILAK